MRGIRERTYVLLKAREAIVVRTEMPIRLLTEMEALVDTEEFRSLDESRLGTLGRAGWSAEVTLSPRRVEDGRTGTTSNAPGAPCDGRCRIREARGPKERRRGDPRAAKGIGAV